MGGRSKSRGRGKGRSKGRGGKKRKDPLTEEEKLAKAQKKAQDEQAKLVKRQQLTKAFLEIKRKKEYELVKISHAKLLDLWRPILRRKKIQELLEDYKMLQRSFERAYDKKAGLINDLEKTLENNEQEYDAAVDMHMYNIDRMMEFYRSRMKGVMQSYTTQKNMLMGVLNGEKDYIMSTHNKDIQGLRNKIAYSEREQFLVNQNAEDELRMKEEIFRTQATTELSSFQYKIEAKIQKYWTDIHESILNFTLLNAKKRKEYLPYLERDQAMSGILNSYYEQLHILKQGLSELRNRSELFAKAFDKYILDLKAKKDECLVEYKCFISAHTETAQFANLSLRNLAFASQASIDKLDLHVKTRERVMRSAERCRKQERVEEKFDPFQVKFDMKNWRLKEIPVKIFACRRNSSQMNSEWEGEDEDEMQPVISDCAMHKDGGCDSALCTCCLMGEDDNCESVNGDGGQEESVPFLEPTLNRNVKSLLNTNIVFEKFWIRYNRADMERQSVKSAREDLLRDNEMLKIALRNLTGPLTPINTEVYANDQINLNRRLMERMMLYMSQQAKRRDLSRKVGVRI